MTFNQARQFVAKYVRGEYEPGEYTRFLQWLEMEATVEETGVIANDYEALFEKWTIRTAEPSIEWMGALEEKLDRLEKEGSLATVRRLYPAGIARKKIGMVAAIAVMLAAGTYWWLARSGNQAGLAGNQSGTATVNPALSGPVFSVPRGGQQQELLLADGTKVWLNSASTIRYAVDEKDPQRLVELSGEAFFDVAKNARQPFVVKIKGAEIEVLGTRFNVRAYEEEGNSKATLVNGTIKVKAGGEEKTLAPGDQAEVVSGTGAAGMMVSHEVDLERVLAWKNGDLEFKNDGLQDVLKEISRSYDLNVKIEGDITGRRFTGVLSRKMSIEQIVDLLKYQNIDVKLDGKTIVVRP